MTQAQPDLLLNHRYRLSVRIGQGGMGEVWQATDEAHGSRTVAVKMMPDHLDATDRRRFEREVRVLREVNHPHVVPLLDLGWHGDALFYVMEYVGPFTLEDVIVAHPEGLPESRRPWLFQRALELLEALQHLHGQRLVHRDVKPANVLLKSHRENVQEVGQLLEDGNPRALLADLGLVARADLHSALTQSALGTPQYMAPERIESPMAIDERSDLWSVGVLLYRGLTGRFPFPRLSDALSRQPAATIEELNEPLSAVVQSLLQFEPHRRPADAGIARSMLLDALEGHQQAATDQPVMRRTHPAFTGRQSALENLKTCAARSARGNGTWLHIEGDEGMGKSWLLRRSEFRSHALVADGMQHFHGSFDGREPHGGYRHLLEQVLGHLERQSGDPQSASDSLGPWGSHLQSVFPRLLGNQWIEGCPPQQETIPEELLRERVFDAVIRCLTQNSEVEPRTLILEDIDRLDEFDMELLRRLIYAAVDLPILVITTAQPVTRQKGSALQRLGQDLELENRFTLITLDPLEADEGSALIHSLLVPEAEVDPAVTDTLFERSNGVPLLLVQLFGGLWNRSALQLDSGRWTASTTDLEEIPVPEMARNHFLEVLEQLDAQQRRVLDVASVMSGLLDFDVLCEACGLDEFELDSQARVLVRQGLLYQEPEGFRWGHSWEQEFVASELTQPMRQRLHLRLGKILEARFQEADAPVQAIAEHFSRGGDESKGREWLLKAADRAESAWALDRALELCERALHGTTDDTVRRTLLARIGDLRCRTGQPESGREAYTQAMGLWTAIEAWWLDEAEDSQEVPTELTEYVDLIGKIGEVQMRAGEYDQALDSFSKSGELSRFAGMTSLLASSRSRMGAAHTFRDDLTAARECYQDAATICAGDDTLDTEYVVALIGLSSLDRRSGKLEAALERLDEAMPIAERSQHPMQRAGIWGQRGTLYQNLGRFSDAVQAYEISRQVREEIGDRRGLAITLMNQGRILTSSGETQRAREVLQQALDLFRETGDLQGRILTLGNLGSLHFHRGEHRLSREMLEEYLRLSQQYRIVRAQADALVSLGMLHLEAHESAPAIEVLAEGRELFEKVGDVQGTLRARLNQARAIGRSGDNRLALESAQEVEKTARESQATPIVIDALRIQAEAHRLLGELDPALEKVEAAIERVADQRLPYAEGCCWRTLGKVQRDRGFEWADRAGIAFEKSQAIFRDHDCQHAMAVTCREFAEFLLGVDESKLAEEALNTAAEIFETLESSVDLKMTQKLIEAGGLHGTS